MSTTQDNIDTDFFNDPTIDLTVTESHTSQSNGNECDENPKENENLPRLKRTACVLCRKRKLKCDGAKPCGTCSRLGHECKYDEVRRKSGPKRGYVKALEARLAQVETMLKTGDSLEGSHAQKTRVPSGQTATQPPQKQQRPQIPTPTRQSSNGSTGNNNNVPAGNMCDTADAPPAGMPQEEMSWNMVSLGLEEPLPTSDVVKDLNEIYFRNIHPSMPIIHPLRFHAAMDLSPQSRPPVALRYAMWTHAAGMVDRYSNFQEYFYRRSRKYLELDEMRGHGEHILSLAHVQTWLLMGMYEIKNMYFPRAWLSAGRAIRLAQMMGIHRLDGTGLMVKQCCAPPKDATEKEERRRTFWMAFWLDRCASMGTGWPMMVEEKDVMTNLPNSESAFEKGFSESTMSLREAMQGKSQGLSPFAGAILLSAIFGRNLVHLHRPESDDAEDDLNGKFWERHRSIDGILLRVGLSLPDHLRIPMGLPDPNVIFLNMCLHTSVICLHQSAIFKADTHKLPTTVSNESKIRCITAATEMAGIVRAVSHMDVSCMNPFVAFNLYVAARVFVQYLKSRRNDTQIQASLGFLLTAMHALKVKNTLTESFLAQLEVDLEAAGLPNMNTQSAIEALIRKGVPPGTRPQPSVNKGAALPPGQASNQGYDHARYNMVFPRAETSQPTGNMSNPIEIDVDMQAAAAPSPEFNLPIHSQPNPTFQARSQQNAQQQQYQGLQQAWHPGDQFKLSHSYTYNDAEEMDLSPGQNSEVGGGATSSNQSQRANSVGTAYTSPTNDSNESNCNRQQQLSQQQQQQQQQRMIAIQRMQGLTGTSPFEYTRHSPGSGPNLASTPTSNVSFSPHNSLLDQQQQQQQLQDFNKQTIDGMFPSPLDGSEFPIPQEWNMGNEMRTGLTPAAVNDDGIDADLWNQFFDGYMNGSGGGVTGSTPRMG